MLSGFVYEILVGAEVDVLDADAHGIAFLSARFGTFAVEAVAQPQGGGEHAQSVDFYGVPFSHLAGDGLGERPYQPDDVTGGEGAGIVDVLCQIFKFNSILTKWVISKNGLAKASNTILVPLGNNLVTPIIVT